MTVYQNRLITLSYLEDDDILSITWSNAAQIDLAELQETIEKVIETIKQYNCRKVLIDASIANLQMDDAALNSTVADFAFRLGQAGVRKVARIITSIQSRETRIQSIRNEVSFPFELYDISNREQALQWLKKA